MNKHQIQKQLKKLNLRTKKSLGQNFLINQTVLNQMAGVIQTLKPKKIIEVGPGLGILTWPLFKMNQPLILIERDKKLCQFWREKNFNVIEGDALKLSKADQECFSEPCNLVGNLPYQIASRLVVQASLEWSQVKNMVIMLQKEVAQRILSPSRKKSFGLLSVLSQCLWDVSFLTQAKVSDFYPPPKVEGFVLVFKRRAEPEWNKHEFFQFIKICFSQRRKFLKKKLLAKYDKDIVEGVFNQLKFPYSVRAEEISPSEFLKMHQQLLKV